MKATFINQVGEHVSNTIKLQGWIYNKRSSGSIAFLQFRDGTGVIQGVVVKNEVKPKVFKLAQELTIESSVILTGMVREDKRSPSGFELTVTNIKLVHLAPDDYPIGKKEHGPDFLLSNRHLWLRSPKQWAIQKIRMTIIQAVEEFYRSENIVKIDTPVITPNACEGTTELFEIDYFGDPAFLSQSGQLYLEAAIASFGRVYDLAPVFRAEKSKTRRHLIEFWMTNAEIAYCDLKQVMGIEENLVMAILNSVLKNCKSELKTIGRDLEPLSKIKAPFPRLKYTEAVKKVKELGSKMKMGDDFGSEDETTLMTHFKQPLFVTHYPAEVKAFYMKKDPKESDKALCVDLLAPEGYGEIIGGSQREDDYDELLKMMTKHKLPIDDYQWYLDLRKYGSVPHSGFGLGIERLVAWICGLKHVRETIPFPRLLHRCYP